MSARVPSAHGTATEVASPLKIPIFTWIPIHVRLGWGSGVGVQGSRRAFGSLLSISARLRVWPFPRQRLWAGAVSMTTTGLSLHRGDILPQSSLKQTWLWSRRICSQRQQGHHAPAGPEASSSRPVQLWMTGSLLAPRQVLSPRL